MTQNESPNIEDRSITIGLKMMWTIVGSLVVASLSLAGIYFDIKSDIKENKSAQITIDAVQNLTLENIKLNATRQEIDLKEMKRLLELKQDKRNNN